MKSTNLLITNTLLYLRTQFTFKLYALWPLSSPTILVWTKLHKLFELGSMLNNYHISLIEFKELLSPFYWSHPQEIISPRKYFSIKWTRNTTQVTSVPTTSSLWRVLSHQSSASFDNMWVSKCTLWTSLQDITQKIFSISMSHACASFGSYIPLKFNKLFLWNFPSAWATDSKASTIARSFLPSITIHTDKQTLEKQHIDSVHTHVAY